MREDEEVWAHASSASWCASQPLTSLLTGIIPALELAGTKIEFSVMPRTSKMSFLKDFAERFACTSLYNVAKKLKCHVGVASVTPAAATGVSSARSQMKSAK
jgi:hypothetical protein